MDPAPWRVEEPGEAGARPPLGPLAEAISHGTSMAERLLASHQLLEWCLHQPSTCADTIYLPKLVGPLLDVAVETARMPQIPVKLLWCLASADGSTETLNALDDAIPTVLGILRGTEDSVLAGALLQLLAQLAHSKSRVLRNQLCNPKAGISQLLLRCLWRWGLGQLAHLEITQCLLDLFEYALHVPCHRNMLRAEVASPSGPLMLPQVLIEVADAAKVRQMHSIKEGSGWACACAQSRQLAHEWTGIAQVTDSLGVR